MRSFDYDVIVIGGGGAGLTAAKTCRGLGKKVALIEKNKLGGECTWTGCVPSKSLIYAAHVAYTAQQITSVGLKAHNDFVLDTVGVMAHVQKTVKDVYSTHTPEKINELGIDVTFGDVRFVDKHTIEIGSVMLTAKKFILCTGSSPFVPLIEGLNSVDYLTNHNLFNLEQLPKSMIIVGGGPIGCEMASALNRLSVNITMIEMNTRILPKEDAELVAMLTHKLQKEGVQIQTNSAVNKVEQHNSIIRVTAQQQDEKVTVEAEKLLIAVGRRPNVDGLNLQATGVAINKQGIIVDSTMRTNIENIYAAGDVVGPYQFSHMAYYQAAIAARNVCVPFFKKKADYTHVCWATFTAPELATAGLTEEAARAAYGDTIQIYRYDYAKLDRAHNDNSTFGLAKIICNKNNKILGAHILGARAGELIGLIQLGKTYNMPFDKLYHVIYPYPTYGEVVWHAAHTAYIKKLENNLLLKLLRKIVS